MPDFQYERKALAQGYHCIAGLDEAGRGALFGPVVAAAVMFSRERIKNRICGWLTEIDDSKRITPRKRKQLCRLILIYADSVGWGVVSNQEIDKNNIFWASLEAMRHAVANLPQSPDFLLVDGFKLNKVNYPQEKILQGDRKSISIAAASIVAKVLRDEMIVHLDRIFERYGLAKNKGYGTKAHFAALQNWGPSVCHRRTFNLRIDTDHE
ncbi:MAG: ribonuclease HII [Candidatus Aminicenantes bacterium]|nr:ribonuclease HII [Candidatus Aminicenantes bacterium]